MTQAAPPQTKTSHVTLQSIADRLGVSRTTVSNAYCHPDQLNPALRQRIFDLAKEMGYTGPNAAARTLRRGRSDALGVLFTEALSYAFTDPAAVLFLQGVAEASEQANVSLLLLPAPPERGPNPAAAREAVVDGFLVYSVPEGDPALDAIFERRLPTVVVDEPRRDGVAFVGIDDQSGARAVAEHLLVLDHHRLAIVVDRIVNDGRTGPADQARQAAATVGVVRGRLQGFADAIVAHGLVWHDVPVYECGPNSAAAGYRGGEAILDLAGRQPPTAILAISDQLALGVLQAARDRGLRVPEDLAVTGFDDIPAAADALPPLTTVRQPLLEKGRVAGRLLLERWPEMDPPTVWLPTELVVRASTGRAPR